MKKPSTRLALVLVLLGITAVLEVNDARSESIDSSCTVTRYCDYGYTLSCTSPNGTCSSGPDNYGWVECDGYRQYCQPTCTSGNGICECSGDSDCCVPQSWCYNDSNCGDGGICVSKRCLC
jgi:hypothetical protein